MYQQSEKQITDCWERMPQGKDKGRAVRLIARQRTAARTPRPGAPRGCNVSDR